MAAIGLGFSAEVRGANYKSPENAFAQGLEAYRRGDLGVAIPALEFAATSSGRTAFLAQFYTARILADNAHGFTNHAKAYQLYQALADAYADIDPDDDQRAPFVAKSLLALAAYLRQGVAEIGLRPNAQRAAQYLHHAATYFADEDAQFELAKLFLTGDGIDSDVKRAIHWLSVLSQRGHASAQAFLADLYWRGRFVPKDPQRAMALITIAVEGAPPQERIWIEDTFQKIFCGTSDGARRELGKVVADWRSKYSRHGEIDTQRSGLGMLVPDADRTCSDGRAVVLPKRTETSVVAETPASANRALPETDKPSPMLGGAAGTGLLDLGRSRDR